MRISTFFQVVWRYCSFLLASVAWLGHSHDRDKDPNLVEWALSGGYDPEQAVLIDASEPTRFLSKREATELITRLAGGFQPGSAVCLHLPNSILYPILVLSILAAGCIWTGTNISYTRAELEHHLRVSGAKYVITSLEHLDTAEAAIQGVGTAIEIIMFSDVLKSDIDLESKGYGYRTLHDLMIASSHVLLEARLRNVHAGTVASLMSTSGTTGLPKMAQRTHRALVAESRSDELYDSDKPYNVRRLFCTPMFHAYSFPKMVINPLRQGQPTYYMKRFDDSFAHKISKFGITDTISVPPILSRLVEQAKKKVGRESLQTLRTILCAGAPLTSKLRTEFLELFGVPPKVVQEWGMTECGCISRVHSSENDTSGSVGRAVGGYQVKIDTEHRMQLADGRLVGELLAKGPQLMTGYLANATATAQAFAPEGWYRTGDVGYIDASGKVYLVDRVKDIIKTNGWQVSPAELEAAVLRFPGIVDTCALSVGHSIDEHPQIFVVKGKEDVTEKQIKEHLRSHLSRYKIASCDVRFVDSLPRAPSGKILRRILRTQLGEANMDARWK